MNGPLGPLGVGGVAGRLTFVRRIAGAGKARAVFRCECGTEKEIEYQNVKNGNTRSCGCLAREASRQNGIESAEKISNAILRHGHSRKGNETPTWRTWAAMIQRCTNPNRDNYQYYGARGISVCERWLDFENFLADMGERPAGLTLDRIDGTGNYDLGNCRWSTRSEQMKNRRPFTRKRHEDPAST